MFIDRLYLEPMVFIMIGLELLSSNSNFTDNFISLFSVIYIDTKVPKFSRYTKLEFLPKERAKIYSKIK
jgi:hypothetical protein